LPSINTKVAAPLFNVAGARRLDRAANSNYGLWKGLTAFEPTQLRPGVGRARKQDEGPEAQTKFPAEIGGRVPRFTKAQQPTLVIFIDDLMLFPSKCPGCFEAVEL
jgi:hypothetical protein